MSEDAVRALPARPTPQPASGVPVHLWRRAILDYAVALDQLARDAAESGDSAIRNAGLAVDAADTLLEFDRVHGTSRGPVSAKDPKWEDSLLAYVRQERDALPQELRATG